MTRSIIIIVLSLILISTTACSKKSHVLSQKDSAVESKPAETNTTDIDFDALSIELCDCASEILKSMDELNKLAEAGDTEGIQKLSVKIEAQSEKMEICISNLETKYPTIDGNPENEAKAEAAVAKNCPQLANMMEAEN